MITHKTIKSGEKAKKELELNPKIKSKRPSPAIRAGNKEIRTKTNQKKYNTKLNKCRTQVTQLQNEFIN